MFRPENLHFFKTRTTFRNVERKMVYKREISNLRRKNDADSDESVAISKVMQP